MLPFTQETKYNISSTIGSDFFAKIPEAIRKHTDWEYSCQEKDSGCYLKPTFKNMPYRNAFVPEIEIDVSCNDTETTLRMRGQPVKSVRVFMALWFGLLLVIELILLALAITSNLSSVFLVFIPVGICLFSYLLCELATKITFKSVVKAIQREIP